MSSQKTDILSISHAIRTVNSIPERHLLADVRPWRDKCMGNIMIAKAFQAVDPSKAARCAQCGKTLVFAECPADHTHPKRLKHANFCKIRLCPMCSWRRSLKLAAQISAVLHTATAQHPNRTWVMLTLTQKNVTSDQLTAEVDKVLKAWKRLTERRDLRSVMGWFRALEVTRNERTGTWHPHVHALLWVRPDYWTRGYISQKRWCQLWAESLRIEYTPIVDVHTIRRRSRRNRLDAAALEVAKYTIKDVDLLHGTEDEITERVRVLDHALRRRHLIGFGGGLKRIARELKDLPAPDEVSACEDPTCPVCGSPLRERLYRWLHWLQNYVADDTEH